jgi:hypothetical protein
MIAGRRQRQKNGIGGRQGLAQRCDGGDVGAQSVRANRRADAHAADGNYRLRIGKTRRDERGDHVARQHYDIGVGLAP